MPKIIFIPEEKEIIVEKGITLFEAAQLLEEVDYECCKLKPVCGKCKVSIIEGMENISESKTLEKEYMEAQGYLPFERLACLCRVKGDSIVEIDKS